jgi:hypothetical protein
MFTQEARTYKTTTSKESRQDSSLFGHIFDYLSRWWCKQRRLLVLQLHKAHCANRKGAKKLPATGAPPPAATSTTRFTIKRFFGTRVSFSGGKTKE